MIGLVAIGFIAGFHTNKIMVHKKVEDIAREGPKMPFHESMLKSLDLTEEQRLELKPVLKEHHQRLREIHRDFRIHRHQMMESFNEAIDPILTEEQKEKLKEHMKRKRRFQERLDSLPGHRKMKKRKRAE